jgi:hypothetical protein
MKLFLSVLLMSLNVFAWKYEHTVDKMDDTKTKWLTVESKENVALGEKARFFFYKKNNQLTIGIYSPLPFVGNIKGHSKIEARIDKNKKINTTTLISDDNKTVFIDGSNLNKIKKEIEKGSDLLISYVDVFGKQVLLEFNVIGLVEAIKKFENPKTKK